MHRGERYFKVAEFCLNFFLKCYFFQDCPQLKEALKSLDKHLLNNTYFATERVTIGDLAILCALKSVKEAANGHRCIKRWCSTLAVHPLGKQIFS
jgi:glutathione S-transferase